MERKAYPSDVSDDEWAFVAPYLTLMREDAPQREHELREVFNGLRWLVRAGAAWRMMPNDLPPWYTVYQQTQRWLAAGVFEAMVRDLRALLRLAAGRAEQPSAAIFDGRTLQSTPESGQRAGYDGHKRRKGSKTHMAVDTLGHLLALLVIPANDQERAQVPPSRRLAEHVAVLETLKSWSVETLIELAQARNDLIGRLSALEAHQFAQQRLGLIDVRCLFDFPMTLCAVGYTRGSGDPQRATLRPFHMASSEGKVPIYVLTAETEAILVQFDPSW